MKTYKYRAWILLLVIALMTACSNQNAQSDVVNTVTSNQSITNISNSTIETISAEFEDKIKFDDDDVNTKWDEKTSTIIELNGDTANITGQGAIFENGNVIIQSDGTYVIYGQLYDGQIVVDSTKDDNVHLVLAGVKIHKEDSAPIYIKQADKAIITLADGTENIVSDGSSYVYPDSTTDEPSATIFSKDDLTINGSGKLIVQANFNDGITSKDDLKIEAESIQITAVDDGIVGRDLITIRNSNIAIEAGGDGMKSTNDTDPEKGSIVIDGGTFHILAGSDGIQAETSLLIGNGTFTIVTGGGSGNAEMKKDGGRWGSRKSSKADSGSNKGLKASTDLYIHGGTFNLNTKDDAIHSNGNVFITAGVVTISSGDDGIHADNNVMISGGTINILKSYEGIEATQVTISDGTIGIVASDDGLNAAGGNDASSMNGRPGQNRFSRSTGTISISGGLITVDAMGDGVDSNGDIYMSGGILLVNGPTANNNGALDYDGTFELTGGVLVAAGSSGMLQGPSTSTNQSSIIMQFSQTQKAGTIVRIEDQSGNDVITFAPSKNFQAIVVSSPNLKQGETYTIYTGGQATGSQTFGLYQDGSYEGGEEIVQFNIGDAVTWLNESGVKK